MARHPLLKGVAPPLADKERLDRLHDAIDAIAKRSDLDPRLQARGSPRSRLPHDDWRPSSKASDVPAELDLHTFSSLTRDLLPRWAPPPASVARCPAPK